MEDLSCPFCHQDVPNGAFVCTGCQAEIDYNKPTWLGSLVNILRMGLMYIFGLAFIFVVIFDRGLGLKSLWVLIIGVVSIWSLGWFQKKYLIEKEAMFHRIRQEK